jgi:hypothetical protein
MFEYHMFYVLYPFVTSFLALPFTSEAKLHGYAKHQHALCLIYGTHEVVHLVMLYNTVKPMTVAARSKA